MEHALWARLGAIFKVKPLTKASFLDVFPDLPGSLLKQCLPHWLVQFLRPEVFQVLHPLSFLHHGRDSGSDELSGSWQRQGLLQKGTGCTTGGKRHFPGVPFSVDAVGTMTPICPDSKMTPIELLPF